MTDFLKPPRELSADEIAKIVLLKEKATSLLEALVAAGLIENLTDESRQQLALAQTRLEECVMWAVKSLTA